MKRDVFQALARRHGLNPQKATVADVNVAVLAAAEASTRRQLEATKASTTSASRPAASPRPVAAAAASAVSAKLHRRPEGGFAYGAGEWPVRMNGAGKPCVFTLEGWTDIAAFEASSGREEDLREAMSMVSFSGSQIGGGGQAAKSFRGGPQA